MYPSRAEWVATVSSQRDGPIESGRAAVPRGRALRVIFTDGSHVEPTGMRRGRYATANQQAETGAIRDHSCGLGRLPSDALHQSSEIALLENHEPRPHGVRRSWTGRRDHTLAVVRRSSQASYTAKKSQGRRADRRRPHRRRPPPLLTDNAFPRHLSTHVTPRRSSDGAWRSDLPTCITENERRRPPAPSLVAELEPKKASTFLLLWKRRDAAADGHRFGVL
mmetsp:Transcript_30186/g.92328  ORF Transcript_30186/g.92328 Transcript_30186/m.92328 type:complete len:222 (-) Transcript_30186:57-722(-)